MNNYELLKYYEILLFVVIPFTAATVLSIKLLNCYFKTKGKKESVRDIKKIG